MSKKFYTADWHLWHDNIRNYCDRPFSTIFEMHDEIVRRHNEKVGPNDLVYVLGDVSFYDKKALPIVEKLNGKLIFIRGNHDAKGIAKWPIWQSVHDYLEVNDKGHKVIMCHYPIASWNGMRKGTVHLHGHSHGNYNPVLSNVQTSDLNAEGLKRFAYGDPKYNIIPKLADVGCDVWDYSPVTLIEIGAKKGWKL